LIPRAVLLACIPVLLCAACGTAPPSGESDRTAIREGLEVVQIAARDLGAVSAPGLLTLLYFDPRHFDLRLLTSAEHGEPRPADRWLEEFGLVAVVNASMYLPNHRSTGLMVDRKRLNNPAVNPRFGGFLAFDPSDSTKSTWAFAGDDCDGFALDRIREDYRVVVQNYRLLDCGGEPTEWTDTRAYSSAAIGRDERGWLVLAHSGAPCRTAEFARWLAMPRFRLTDAHFVEGGPEASLMLRDGSHEFRVVGSWPGMRAPTFRDVPNVIGVVAR
jgi:hypothetical protein